MGKAVVTPATQADAVELAPHLREADVLEMRTLGQEPLEALQRCLGAGGYAFALRLGGELAALFGVAPTGEAGVALSWALTGEAVERHPVAYVKAARQVLPELHRMSGCGELRNWVDARYQRSLALWQRQGFKVLATRALGPAGETYHLLSRRA